MGLWFNHANWSENTDCLEGATVSIPYQVRDEIMGDGSGDGIASETITYAVSVQNSVVVTNSMDGVEQEKLVLIEGNTYVFQNATNHPLRFSTAQDGAWWWRRVYRGVSYNSSGQVTINVTPDTPVILLLRKSSGYGWCSTRCAV